SLRGIRLVQTNSGTDLWNMHEVRIFDGARELPRDPGWRLTASPSPWGIQDAFDNSLATLWLSGDPIRPGMFVETDFHRMETADSVVVEAAPDQGAVKLKLEGQDSGGVWMALAGTPQVSEAGRPLGLRRALAQELKARGFDYVLMFDTDLGADDLRRNAAL